MGELGNIMRGFQKMAPTIYDNLRSLVNQNETETNLSEDVLDNDKVSDSIEKIEPSISNADMQNKVITREEYQLNNIKRLIKKTDKK